MAVHRVALVSEVFFGEGAPTRLCEALAAARGLDAELAVLPELALDPWVPCSREVRDDDAEPEGGPRIAMLSACAQQIGIAVVGGAIVRAADGTRFNTAVVVDAQGRALARYAKTHVPQEPGFWERDHYADGRAHAQTFVHRGLAMGLQICSDINRPEGVHALAAAGAQVVLHPRATEPDTFDAWRLVMRATAMTSCCWILSVNRPRPEGGTPLGGPSCVVAPDGEVIVESREPITIAQIDDDAVAIARKGYPGYLPVRSDLYARAWNDAPSSGSATD
ncbi:MAG TPA: carbon-nitrogen hydrolase family protein [Nannocystaceae bacterium]|nr:carbon-nitrogen hydrolase family protein [Nannocystaceae bacterium]